LTTVKDYAARWNVSTVSVYKLLKTHKAELEGLIVKENRKMLLTDEAVKVLDKVKSTHPQPVEQIDNKEELEVLKRENHNLLIKIAELQEKLIESKEMINLLQSEKVELLEDKNRGFLSRLFKKKN